ncbi:MAG TPA: hypothetical protein VJK06_03390 [Methyloceanibacter sp.]|nr:hypothetical protein [Methyloceanibacter sp.]
MCHRVAFLGFVTALAVVSAASSSLAAPAAKLNTEAFLAACSEDEVVTGQLGSAEEITPKQFCDCVAGKLPESKLSQTDVDMLTKMHKDAITDEDATSYSTLEDLLKANERIEDGCKKSLGVPVNADGGDDAPEDEEMPADEAPEGESE